MRRPPRGPFALVLIAILGSLPSEVQAQVSRFVDSVEAPLVNVDVVVTDRKGRPVGGLTREDFVLLVDGQPVEITHFADLSELAIERASPLLTEGAPEGQSHSTNAAGRPTGSWRWRSSSTTRICIRRSGLDFSNA